MDIQSSAAPVGRGKRGPDRTNFTLEEMRDALARLEALPAVPTRVACAALDCSRPALQQLVAKGRLPEPKPGVGRELMWRSDAILAVMTGER